MTIMIDELRCPHCDKKLAEMRQNRFETFNGAIAIRILNDSAIIIKCPRCKNLVDVLAEQEKILTKDLTNIPKIC